MSNTVKDNIRAMIESIIKGDVEDAATYLHEVASAKTKRMIIGEEESCDDDDKDSDDKDDDDKDDDKDDDDDKEDVKESSKAYTETPPSPGSQDFVGKGSSKMGKYKLPNQPDDSIKGDALKGKGSSSSKAFTEKPKNPPEYKDDVDHKAGGVKNRAKAGK